MVMVTDNVGCTQLDSIVIGTAIYGCIDPNACNFNPSATIDDGTCLTIYGCTDPNAFNYLATNSSWILGCR